MRPVRRSENLEESENKGVGWHLAQNNVQREALLNNVQ
jgi:hypothetical protein